MWWKCRWKWAGFRRRPSLAPVWVAFSAGTWAVRGMPRHVDSKGRAPSWATSRSRSRGRTSLARSTLPCVMCATSATAGALRCICPSKWTRTRVLRLCAAAMVLEAAPAPLLVGWSVACYASVCFTCRHCLWRWSRRCQEICRRQLRAWTRSPGIKR